MDKDLDAALIFGAVLATIGAIGSARTATTDAGFWWWFVLAILFGTIVGTMLKKYWKDE